MTEKEQKRLATNIVKQLKGLSYDEAHNLLIIYVDTLLKQQAVVK